MSTSSSLSVQMMQEAILTPVEHRDDHFRFCVGAFSPDGTPLDGCRLVRVWGRSADGSYQDPTRTVTDAITYGGFLDGHYGHFLLESLSRLWWLRRAGVESILWHSWNPRVTAWQREIFELAGISPERFVYVSEPVRVRHITIADPGFVIGAAFHPIHAESLELIQFKAPVAGKKVWLSRAALPPGSAQIGGEAHIEESLRRQGWTIAHPEALSLSQKIELLAEAETIAGIEASAFHLLILARDCRAKIRILVRRSHLHPSYRLIAQTKRLQQSELLPDMETTVGADGVTRKSIARFDQVIDFVNGSP